MENVIKMKMPNGAVVDVNLLNKFTKGDDTIYICYSQKRLFTSIIRNGEFYYYTLLNNYVEVLPVSIFEDPENFCIEEIMREYCMDAETAQSYFIGEYYYSFGNVLG